MSHNARVWHEEGRAEGHLLSRSQLTRLSAPCLHSTPYTGSCPTHTCSYTHPHTRHVCIVWWGMTSPHTHTNTPKQLQKGQSPGPAGTDGVSWELTACPAALKSHIHTVDRTWQKKCAVHTNMSSKIYKSPEKLRHFKKLFHKSNTSPVFCPIMALWGRQHQSVHCPLGLLVLIGTIQQAASTGSWEQFRECESMKQGSSQRRCVCAAGTCGWRSERTSRTGTSSLRSGSAGGRAGWSDQQRPGYSVGRRRDAHLKGEKMVSIRKTLHTLTGQRVWPLVIVFQMAYRQLTKGQEHYPNSLNADCLFSCVTIGLRLD